MSSPDQLVMSCPAQPRRRVGERRRLVALIARGQRGARRHDLVDLAQNVGGEPRLRGFDLPLRLERRRADVAGVGRIQLLSVENDHRHEGAPTTL
ncbi:MAG TPA: hypothetical protein VGD53_19885 [Actinoallomurus sp.]|jgi:hypothetical protein